jgi:hypothetical protein
MLLHKIFKFAKGGYEALSYVWKDSYDIEGILQLPNILVNGACFLVTRNLRAALVRLRDNDSDRIL